MGRCGFLERSRLNFMDTRRVIEERRLTVCLLSAI